jgi:hypothetical protein
LIDVLDGGEISGIMSSWEIAWEIDREIVTRCLGTSGCLDLGLLFMFSMILWKDVLGFF